MRIRPHGVAFAEVALEHAQGERIEHPPLDGPLERTRAVTRSTQVLDRLGEEASAATMRRHFELLREALQAEGGVEVKSLGDGLMVVFRSALAAVRAGVAMQRSVAGLVTGPAGGGDDELGLP